MKLHQHALKLYRNIKITEVLYVEEFWEYCRLNIKFIYQLIMQKISMSRYAI